MAVGEVDELLAEILEGRFAAWPVRVVRGPHHSVTTYRDAAPSSVTAHRGAGAPTLAEARASRAQRDADLLRRLLQTTHEIQLVIAPRRRDRARLRIEHARRMRSLARDEARSA